YKIRRLVTGEPPERPPRQISVSIDDHIGCKSVRRPTFYRVDKRLMIYFPVMAKLSTPGELTRRKFLRSASAKIAAALALPGAIAAAHAAQRQAGLKLYVLWDMEGTSGIFTREQAWYWENGVREQVAMEVRGLFTSNVNALSAAALERGATELIVCDTHHGGGNLVRDK